MKKQFFAVLTALAEAVLITACGNNQQIISPTPTGTEVNNPTDTIKPTDTPTDKPVTPTAGETTPTASEPSGDPTPTSTPTPTPLPQKDLSEFNPLDFFKDAIYIGDSLMNFYQWRGNSYVHPDIFGKYSAKLWQAVNSFAVRFAIRDVSTLSEAELGFVPKYNGEARQMWDVVAESGKTRVFMFFGLNDIGVSGVDKFIEQYQELIGKIKAKTPAVKIYIMSITSMRKDKQSTTGGLSNAKIKEANERLEALCAQNGWCFVDVASKLRDADYNLLLTLPDGTKISDGTNVHIEKAGYVFWDEALEKTAREELRKEYYEGGNK